MNKPRNKTNKKEDEESQQGDQEARQVAAVTSDNYVKETIHFVSALTFSRLISTAGNYANMVLLAKLGQDELAASSLISVTQSFVINTSTASLTAVLDRISHEVGKTDEVKIKLYFKNGMLFAAILSIPSIAIALASSQIFKGLSHPTDNVTDIQQSYFNGFFWGIPANLLLWVEQNLVFATKRTKPATLINLSNSACTAGFASLLVLEIFDSPLSGAATIGNIISIFNWSSLFVFTAYLYRSDKFSPLIRAESPGNDIQWPILKELLSIGLPTTIQVGSELISVYASVAIMGDLIGKSAYEANQIATQYLLLTLIPGLGISIGSDILVGLSMGRKRFSDAKRYGNLSLLIGTGFSVVSLILVSSIPKQLMKPFIDVDDSNNNDIIDTTTTLLIMNGVGQIFDIIRNISAASLKGAFGETGWATWTGISCFCVLGIPLSYGLGYSWGMTGIYIARDISMALGGAVLLTRWTRMINKLVAETSGLNLNSTNSPQYSSMSNGIKSITYTENQGDSKNEEKAPLVGKKAEHSDLEDSSSLQDPSSNPSSQNKGVLSYFSYKKKQASFAKRAVKEFTRSSWCVIS